MPGFAIIVDTLHGLHSVPQDILDVARVLKGRPLAVFFKVRLPSALPSILAGMKVAVSLALVGAIVGEFVSSQRGLGYVIITTQSSMNTPAAFAALAWISVLGLLLFGAVAALSPPGSAWRRNGTGLRSWRRSRLPPDGVPTAAAPPDTTSSASIAQQSREGAGS